MKKLLFFAIVMIAFCQMAFSQIEVNSTGQVGIGVAPNSNYRLSVGTGSTYINGNLGLGVAPHSTHRFYVSGDSYLSGYVGLGVAPSTSYRLNVNGTSNFSGVATFNNDVKFNVDGSKCFEIKNGSLNTYLEIGVAQSNASFHRASKAGDIVIRRLGVYGTNKKLIIGTATDSGDYPAQAVGITGANDASAAGVWAYNNLNVRIGAYSETPPDQRLLVDGTTFQNGNLGVGAAPKSNYGLYVSGCSHLSGNTRIGVFYGSLSTPTNNLEVDGSTYINGSLKIEYNPSMVARLAPDYNLIVNGNAQFNLGALVGVGTLLIKGVPEYSGNPPYQTVVNRLTLYPSTSEGVNIGTSDNRFKHVYSFYYNGVGILSPSDMRIKENIKPCPSLISKIKEIQSYTFNFKKEFFGEGLTEEEVEIMRRTEYGFIAQEVQKIFPELIYEHDSLGMLSVNYVSMIPILTAAIKEQQQMIDEQMKMINEQANKIRELEKLIATGNHKSNETDERISTLKFNLSQSNNFDKEDMQLFQNAPNPFNQNTFVRCYVPKTIEKVQLCVYNMQGVQIKCLNINERGDVEVMIEAGALASGIYAYLLIGDGKTSEAKNMILTK